MLNDKQQRFIEEYMIDLNGTQAYIRAGYNVSEEVARRNASRLLTNVDIKGEIDKRLALKANEANINADIVLKDLIELKDKCMGRKKVKYSASDGEEIEKYIFDSKGAKGALELLGKYLKLFTDKVESNVDANITVKLEGELEEWAK